MTEKSEEQNEIQERSFAFALRIFKLCKYLENDRTARIISRLLLKSGSSIGVNVEEALGGQSRKDINAKMSIALKEALVTNYWLRLLRDSETVKEERIASLIEESEQLVKLLSENIVTSKKKDTE